MFFVTNLGCCPVQRVKTWAMLKELETAIHARLSLVEVECDNIIVINMIQGTSKPDIFCAPIIEQIKRISNYFQVITFKHVHREANFCS